MSPPSSYAGDECMNGSTASSGAAGAACVGSGHWVHLVPSHGTTGLYNHMSRGNRRVVQVGIAQTRLREPWGQGSAQTRSGRYKHSTLSSNQEYRWPPSCPNVVASEMVSSKSQSWVADPRLQPGFSLPGGSPLRIHHHNWNTFDNLTEWRQHRIHIIQT